jgi:cytochrome c553
MPGLANLTQPGVAWGNGANGSGVGPAATVSCGSCHNPHGNGQYRILNTLPAAVDSDAVAPQFSNAWVIQVFDYGVVAPNVYRSVSSMGVLNGDKIVITGNTLTGANTTAAGAAITMVDAPACPPAPIPVGTTCDSDTTPNDNLFTLAGMTDASNGTGGTATRIGGTKVTDAALPPAGDARNYTVIQTPYNANPALMTLLASQADGYANDAGDYFHYRVPWNGVSGTNLDAPNGIPGNNAAVPVFAGGFGEQMAAWCASCHTRYWAWQEPTEDPADGATLGAAYANARPGDSIYEYQHRTRGASGRGCLTCHVSHGSNAAMTEANSANYTFPDGTVSNNSRLLKVDNRGTCQQCHDPTGTSVIGDQFPPGPVPGTP